MIKFRADLPPSGIGNNSQGNKGVGNNNANQTPTVPRGNAYGHHKSQSSGNNANNQLVSLNLKVQLGGNINSSSELQLGKSAQRNFSSNINVSLNANGNGFSLGLTQNLQIAITILFELSTPAVQNALRGFTGQEVTTSLFLNAGLFNELQTNGRLHNKGQNPIIDNPVVNQILTILANNNPTSNNPLTDTIIRIRNLWNNSGGLFSDCACAITVKDLQTIAKHYVNTLQGGDVDTLVKLTQLIQNGQNQAEKGNNKFNNLLFFLITNGQKFAINNAQLANLNFLKNSNALIHKNVQPQNPPKSLDSYNLNKSVGTIDQSLISEKHKPGKNDFYTEKTENALRKQLDYYPHYAYDRQISTFENPDEVNMGKQEFVDKYYSEIEDWLKSGKHRLVKDFEFDKPIGMVVEREASGFITADKLRVVLVRDGSVEGWHFLRSFLIS